MNNHDTISDLESLQSLLDKQRVIVNRILNSEYFKDPLLKNVPDKIQTEKQFMKPVNINKEIGKHFGT